MGLFLRPGAASTRTLGVALFAPGLVRGRGRDPLRDSRRPSASHLAAFDVLVLSLAFGTLHSAGWHRAPPGDLAQGRSTVVASCLRILRRRGRASARRVERNIRTMRRALAASAAVLIATACAVAPAGAGASPSPAAPEATASITQAVPTPSFEPSAAPASSEPEEAHGPRATRPIAGMECALGGDSAALRLESAIARADEATLLAAVEADLKAVERELDRRFAARPVIYVYATTESYARGLAGIFGYPQATAALVAENSVSFFEPALPLIAVNWEAVRFQRPIAAIRHELTHLLTLDACAPRCDLVPAWLNEGQARLAEALVPGGDWRLVRVRFEAASMAATGTLIPLSSLVSQLSWNALTDWAGYYKYQEAARATELLRADIGGGAPMARIYERIRGGQTVAQAYAALAGRSFDDFVASLPARMREIAARFPGIVALPGIPQGAGGSYLLYGLPPTTTVILTISGPRRTESWPVVVSPFGSSFDSLTPSAARGTYTISVQHAGGVLTATVTKLSAGAQNDPR